DTEILDATDSTLNLLNVQPSDAGSYTVVITNSLGSVTSNAAVLNLTGVPVSITTQPAPEIASAGNAALFAVTAGGSPPLTYQWRKDGNVLPGQTSAVLSLANIQASSAGNYDVVVTNGIAPAATSGVAALTIGAIPPNIAVERIGDGTTLLSGSAMAVAV